MNENNSLEAKVSDPISIASHQLKNPISIIRAYVEVLLSGSIGKLNDKQREYLQDTAENIERMSKVVKEFLDISSIEENRYGVKSEPVNIVKITEEVIEDFAFMAKASKSKIIFTKPKHAFLVATDRIKIRQVIANLISNAIIYKGSGLGKIEVGIEERDGWIIFSCKDNGMGISAEGKKKVFSKFYRSEDAVAIDSAGTGLGLYINKAIIELSGGKIWFENNKGEGVTFYFSVPILPSKK